MAVRKWMPSSFKEVRGDLIKFYDRQDNGVVGYIRERATSGYEWMLGCRGEALMARGTAVTSAIAKKRCDAAYKSKCGG